MNWWISGTFLCLLIGVFSGCWCHCIFIYSTSAILLCRKCLKVGPITETISGRLFLLFSPKKLNLNNPENG